MKEKNRSIELLKFLAVIIVANSHMDPLYGQYGFFATGGAIGDALFFFASGFTLFLGRFGRFDNWYKRRIKRIYPSVIAYAVVLALIGFWQMPVTQIIKGGDWFITCIMLYYVVLYFVRKWYSTKPLIPFIVAGLTIIIWYSFENSDSLFMYGSTYFKWGHYFLYMLAGAYVGGNVWQFKSKPILDALLLITCIVIFYGIQFLASKSVLLARFQILSLLPLMGIVLFTYKLCCCERLKQMMNTKGGLFLRFIAGLCLEAYIVQLQLINYFNGKLTSIIPVDIIITFIIIIIAAYVVRCLARVFSQLFEKEDFDWKSVVRLVD